MRAVNQQNILSNFAGAARDDKKYPRRRKIFSNARETTPDGVFLVTGWAGSNSSTAGVKLSVSSFSENELLSPEYADSCD
jgi:hypothetical protein